MHINGEVRQFARLEPAYVRLVGQAGTEIKETVTIVREKDYPFKIVDVKARNGSDIIFDIKEFGESGQDGYVLTIANQKTTAGQYADSVTLTTDSAIKPMLTIPVYGQIILAGPPSEPASPKDDKGNN